MVWGGQQKWLEGGGLREVQREERGESLGWTGDSHKHGGRYKTTETTDIDTE